MKDRSPPPPATGKPAGDGNVISIVERIQRRQLAHERGRIQATHLRELEKTVEVLESTKNILETDFDAELTKLGPMAADEARIPKAMLRSTRALQTCLRGNPEEGLKEWEEIIAIAPELAYPLLLRARWTANTDLEAALADYDRAAAVEPKNPLVYWRRAFCLRQLGDKDRALANYRRAIGLDPTSIDVLRETAELLAERGDHAEAIAVCDKAVALAPRYVDFHFMRGQARMHLEEFDAALRDHARVLELDPSRNDVRYYRVICLDQAGHRKRAIEEMERLIAIEPGDHHNHRILGKLRFEEGQVAAAIEDLSRAVALDPACADSLAQRAHAYVAAGEKARALADFDRAAALQPDEPSHVISRTLLRLPDLSPAEAAAELDRLVALRSDDPALLELRAGRLQRDGDHAGAVANYDLALGLDPNDPDLYVGRAKAYASLGRLEDALADATRLCEIAPDHAFGHSMRAAYREHLEGDPALVAADFDRAVELAPDDASVRFHRGEYLQRKGKYAAAIPDYDRTIEIVPRLATAYLGRAECRSRLGEEQSELDEEWEEDEEVEKARYRAVIEDCERAIELGLRSADAFIALWNAHCVLKDDPGMIAALNRGIEAQPSCSLLYFWRHGSRQSLGDVEGAAADRARAIELGFKFNGE